MPGAAGETPGHSATGGDDSCLLPARPTAGRAGGPTAYCPNKNPPAVPPRKRSLPLTYRRYLGLDRILSAQKCVARPPARDELQFIIVHQVYELWFKLLIFET